MDIEKLADNFGKFLSKYSGELRTLASTVQTVVDHLPIDGQDKERLSEILGTLQEAATRVASAAGELLGQPIEVVVSKEDVAEAVSDYMEAHPTGDDNAGN